MTHHVHLLVTARRPMVIAKVMQSVGRRYVRYINHEYRRSGTLWEGRYKASLIESETYLLNCYRYIESHPLRAAMVRGPEDYAYAESLFRTANYRPEFPVKGFEDLEAARAWAAGFVRWYNLEHRHSGIRYVSPAQRHDGADRPILAARHALYIQARERNPARWSGTTRNWSPVLAVTLNRERECVINTHVAETFKQLAACMRRQLP